jgi:hypothetical protein
MLLNRHFHNPAEIEFFKDEAIPEILYRGNDRIGAKDL